MKAVLYDLLAKKKKHYRDDYNEMLGDYKRELETIEGYNGRQLLELLQNCDDQCAEEVLIELNISNRTISIISVCQKTLNTILVNSLVTFHCIE